jgi:hypothetical protein
LKGEVRIGLEPKELEHLAKAGVGHTLQLDVAVLAPWVHCVRSYLPFRWSVETL